MTHSVQKDKKESLKSGDRFALLPPDKYQFEVDIPKKVEPESPKKEEKKPMKKESKDNIVIPEEPKLGKINKTQEGKPASGAKKMQGEQPKMEAKAEDFIPILNPPDDNVPSLIRTTKLPCKYGSECSRKKQGLCSVIFINSYLKKQSKDHFDKYSHPCKYGAQCYQQKISHFDKYHHPWDLEELQQADEKNNNNNNNNNLDNNNNNNNNFIASKKTLKKKKPEEIF